MMLGGGGGVSIAPSRSQLVGATHFPRQRFPLFTWKAVKGVAPRHPYLVYT